ncbi:MAG: DUF3500 domain-containing protein [Planctomycetaceae bacterium]|nr:DUF3500 domain-containing protein [Planctomycetaceae bacterium]
MQPNPHCPDCENLRASELVAGRALSRRDFVRVTGTVAATAAAGSLAGPLRADQQADRSKAQPEKLVETLYQSLSPAQKEKICFAWDHTDDRGLLRTHVSNNWSITDPKTLNVGGAFFTSDQQELIEALFFKMYNPEWHDRIRKQLQDDAGGYGKQQTIAIFGEPGTNQFEFVMTGRHLTIRCDGDSTEHVAFGGPIFYGHAAQGFDEKPDHPGNVFWPQALKANKLYTMLDGKQRQHALVKETPYETEVAFRGAGSGYFGIPVTELSADQKEFTQQVLKTLIEPYRVSDRDEVMKCLDAQGGIDACHLAFFESEDIGEDGVWDIWRLEGPSFVWHFRGAPHVHVWVNVADDPSVKLNAAG